MEDQTKIKQSISSNPFGERKEGERKIKEEDVELINLKTLIKEENKIPPTAISNSSSNSLTPPPNLPTREISSNKISIDFNSDSEDEKEEHPPISPFATVKPSFSSSLPSDNLNQEKNISFNQKSSPQKQELEPAPVFNLPPRPPLNKSSENQEENRLKEELKQPSGGIKNIIFVSLGILLLLALGGGVYYFLSYTPSDIDEPILIKDPAVSEPVSPEQPPKQDQIHQLDLGTEKVIIDALNSEEDILREIRSYKQQAEGVQTLNQLVVTMNGNELTLKEFTQAIKMNIPENIASESSKYALAVYQENNFNKIGLIIETTNSPETTKDEMLQWEKTMLKDLSPIFNDESFNEQVDTNNPIFNSSTKFPNGRFLILNQEKNLSLDYSILTDSIIIASSYTVMEKLIETIVKQ